MIKVTQFDSLKWSAGSSTSPSPSKKKKSELMETIMTLAERLATPSAPSVNELQKLHLIISQLEDRVEQLKSESRSVATLKSSLSMYRMNLSKLEAQYAEVA